MTKEELKKYISIQRRIEAKEEESERLRAKIESAPTRILTGPPRSTDVADRMADLVAKLIDLREQINKEYDELIKQRDKIIAAINKLEPRYALLLEKRYIQNLRFEQIAIDMIYSVQRIWQMHGKALQKIRDY